MSGDAATPRVLTFGETMGLATNQHLGRMTTSRDYSMSFGGAESNVAIALARLGIPSTWVSRLGSDPFGDLIVRELRSESVTVVAERDPNRPTGFMLKERRTSGMGAVYYWRRDSAAASLRPSDVSDELIAGADLMHVTGITPALSDDARATVFDALRRAAMAGVPVSFDVNHRTSLWSSESAAAAYREILPYCRVVFAGDDEAALIVGEVPPSDLARRLVELGARDAVIKLGAAGCVALIDGEPFHRPARRVDVVDTVGAGDAFVAGYLSEAVVGSSPAARLERAVTTGAFACTSRGDWEGSATRGDLLDFERSEGVSR